MPKALVHCKPVIYPMVAFSECWLLAVARIMATWSGLFGVQALDVMR